MTAGVADDLTPDIASWPPLDNDDRVPGQQLLDWAADSSGAGPRLCLVRGAGGSGKSRLLAWFLAGSAGHPRTTVHATVPAEGLTAQTFAWELGRQLGYGPMSPARLLDRIGRDERPLLLLVPDLHRAGAGLAQLPAATPADLVADLLEPLLLLAHVRAAVEVGASGSLPTEDAVTTDLGGPVAVPDEGEEFGEIAQQGRGRTHGLIGDRQDPRLRAALETRGTGYVLAVACSTQARVNQGRTAVRADTIAERLPATTWQRHSAGSGAKGRDATTGPGSTTAPTNTATCSSAATAPLVNWPSACAGHPPRSPWPRWFASPASAGASRNASRPPGPGRTRPLPGPQLDLMAPAHHARHCSPWPS